jgi:hypothetical protein
MLDDYYDDEEEYYGEEPYYEDEEEEHESQSEEPGKLDVDSLIAAVWEVVPDVSFDQVKRALIDVDNDFDQAIERLKSLNLTSKSKPESRSLSNSGGSLTADQVERSTLASLTKPGALLDLKSLVTSPQNASTVSFASLSSLSQKPSAVDLKSLSSVNAPLSSSSTTFAKPTATFSLKSLTSFSAKPDVSTQSAPSIPPSTQKTDVLPQAEPTDQPSARPLAHGPEPSRFASILFDGHEDEVMPTDLPSDSSQPWMNTNDTLGSVKPFDFADPSPDDTVSHALLQKSTPKPEPPKPRVITVGPSVAGPSNAAQTAESRKPTGTKVATSAPS